MKNKSTSTKNGLVKKSTGRKIGSPLDKSSNSDSVQSNVRPLVRIGDNLINVNNITKIYKVGGFVFWYHLYLCS